MKYHWNFKVLCKTHDGYTYREGSYGNATKQELQQFIKHYWFYGPEADMQTLKITLKLPYS